MTIRVNGKTVPDQAVQYELDRLVKFYSAHVSAEELKSQYDVLHEKAKQQAIGAQLLLEQAEHLDIPVPQEEIEERLNAMIESAGGAEAFEELCRRQNLTGDMVRHSIEQDRQTARSRLEEIRLHLEDGAEFADEAAAHSECPSGRKTGGSLGWVERGMVLPALDDVIFSMAVDTLSGIIESPLGFHLVFKSDAEEGGPADYADVSDRIRDLLRHARRGEAISSYVEELREKAVIEEV